MSYSQLLSLLVPEIVVLVAGLAVLGADLGLMRQRRMDARIRLAALLSCLGLIGAFCCAARLPLPAIPSLWDGMLVINSESRIAKELLLVLSIISVLFSAHARFTAHIGEYFLLLLLATLGMMFLVSSANLLVIFVSLELLSLSLYIITAFNKQSIQSAEAALKYFLFGGMSAAFMLFGLSLLYGASGELNLIAIAGKLKGTPVEPMVGVALVMVVIGFGFKIAAVPFHLWAPDTYQGAPLPAAAFIASGSKLASFFILARVLLGGFDGTEGSLAFRHFAPGWLPLIALIATASMIIGNFAAIAQKSVRRLLAYSAVAQAGYILVGILANNTDAISSVLFYVFTYAITVTGAFCVLAALGDNPQHERLTSLAGFAKREPLLSLCMLIFILSLAGIPPLAGFFGKFYLFAAALNSAKGNATLIWLIALALAMSTVSLYYYLQVLKQIYVASPADPATSFTSPPSKGSLRLLTVALALAVIAFGLAPNLLLNKIRPQYIHLAR